MTLTERCQDIRQKFRVELTPCTLRQYYARQGVQFKAVDNHSLNKLGNQAQIRAQQMQFVMTLRNCGKKIYYLDETSVSLWYTQKKTWTSKDDPVYLPL